MTTTKQEQIGQEEKAPEQEPQEEEQQTIDGDGDGRKRAPVYNVFEVRKLYEAAEASEPDEAHPDPGAPEALLAYGDAVSGWVLIADGVKAASDRAAIEQTLDRLGREGDDRLGTFWAPLAGTFKPRSLGQRTITEPVWS